MYYLPTYLFRPKVGYLSESVDSLCRDGADTHYPQYLLISKSRITLPQIRYKLIQVPWRPLWVLYNQKDSYKRPKATRKTAKRKSVLILSFLLRPLFSEWYLANGLSGHHHFSTKLMLITPRSSTITQRLHSFKFTLVNKSHSQHSVVAVRCEGCHFIILYACTHVVSFPDQIPWSLV